MRMTVLIPTYRRPNDLARCLKALQQQRRAADEVLVVVQKSDVATWDLLKILDLSPLPLHPLTVEIPGVVAALNTGFDAAQGDIISITDDDAAPHLDWLERIEAHFLADNRLGAVGGRDWIYLNSQLVDGTYRAIGKVKWYGQIMGNHHAGKGDVREVDVLKGVNSSYRRQAIQNLKFDHRLRGTGAQTHWELIFDLALKRAGWKIIYDPLVAVDHYPAQRFDEDQRDEFNLEAWINWSHNETLALLEDFSPFRRLVFGLWAVLVGTRSVLGLVQLARFWPRQKKRAIEKWQASMQGRWLGLQTWWRTRSAQDLHENFKQIISD
jgi:glycosyltransferase involved in cell wall biosynthesis